MITYQITVTSKNLKSLKLFFLFCCQNKNFNIKTTFYKKKTKKKTITVLKSPHVYKKAQSQWEYKLFSTKIKISSQNSLKSLILLKKIKSKLFPEIKLQTKIIINKQNQFNLQNKALTPKKFTINNFNNFKINSKNKQIITTKKILNYIKIFDCLGELILNQNM